MIAVLDKQTEGEGLSLEEKKMIVVLTLLYFL
jgi:hypothetical protein